MFGATRAKASVGPKQQKCLAAGGSWEGAVGAKKCVMPTAGAPSGATGGALPKAGSTVSGPIPTEWVGTEKAGAKGPKQVTCEGKGGHWIGPEGKRWCPLPPSPVIAASLETPAVQPTDTGLVSTGAVPPGATTTGGALPQWGGEDLTPDQAVQPGLQTEATGAPGGAMYASVTGPLGISKNTWTVLVIVGFGALVYYAMRKPKGGKRAFAVPHTFRGLQAKRRRV